MRARASCASSRVEAWQRALGRRRFAAPQQAVDALALHVRRQDAAEALHDVELVGGLEAAGDPGVAHHGAAARRFARGDERLAELVAAQRRHRIAPREEGDDGARVHGGVHGLLGAREQRVLRGPAGIGLDEGADLAERGAAVLVDDITPFDEAAGDGVVALGGEAACPRPIAAVGGIEGAGVEIVIAAGERADGAGAALERRRGAALGRAQRIRDRLHHHHVALADEARRQVLCQDGDGGQRKGGGSEEKGVAKSHRQSALPDGISCGAAPGTP